MDTTYTFLTVNRPESMWMAAKRRGSRGTALMFVLCAAVVAAYPAPAQIRPPDEAALDTQTEPYLVRAWTTADGLPANLVVQILQTQDGYVWMASAGGLVRFNGYDFHVFTTDDFPGWTTSFVIELYEGRDGALWFSSYTGELARLKDGEFTSFFREDGSPIGTVRDWLELDTGTLWIATETGAVRMRDGQVKTFTTAEGLPSDYIVGLRLDRQDHLTVATNVSLARLVEDTFVAYGSRYRVPGDASFGMYLPEENEWWIASEDSLLRLQAAQGIEVPVPDVVQGVYVTQMHRDDGERLWLNTTQGLFTWKEGALTPFMPERGFMHDNADLHLGAEGRLYFRLGPVDSRAVFGRVADGQLSTLDLRRYLDYQALKIIYEDAERNVWVSTTDGLFLLVPHSVRALTEKHGLSEKIVFAITQAQSGDIWVGTWGGGVNRLQGGQITLIDTTDGLLDNFVRVLHEDRFGNIWVGTRRGTSMLHEGKVLQNFPSQTVFSIHEDSQHRLWVGRVNGLSVLERDASGTYQATVVSTEAREVRSIHEDRQGRLWAATRNGLLRLDGDDWRTYTTRDGLSSDFLVAIYEEPDGTLWFTTYGNGLNRFEDDRFFVFTADDGLHSDGVWRILEDGYGNFWMCSDTGLFRVRQEELRDFAEDRIERITSVVYTEADGMPSAECTPGGWKMQHGELWFATIDGIAMVDPEQLPGSAQPPPVHIESVRVDGVPVSSAQTAHLPRGSRNVEISYAALRFAAPEKTEYRYRLEGYDRDWVDAGSRRAAFYTNLPPGAYTFRVTASRGDGVWNEAGASLAFRLKPFFYQARWFYLLCTLFIASLVGAAYRYRIKYLREIELEREVEERTQRLIAEQRKTEVQADQLKEQAERLREMDRLKSRFFANISHEFRTPLTMILGPIQDVLAGQYGSIETAVHQALKPAARNAWRLERLIDQLLDLSKLEAEKMPLRPRTGDLVAFVRSLVHLFSPLAERKHVALHYHPQAEHLPLAFDAEKLEKAVGNLLANAIKFTPEQGKVLVTVAGGEEHAVIRVQDTGIGIPSEEMPHLFDRFYQVDRTLTRSQEGTGLGLSIARELVGLHGGTIAVESVPGFGATFVVTLPRISVSKSEMDEDDEREEEQGVLRRHSEAIETVIALEPPESVIESVEPDATESVETPRLLIVEDHADVRAYLRAHFAGVYHVDEARTGAEALEQVRAARPDLILCDVMLPEMDGLALCRRLRKDEALRHIPILLVTARADVADAVAGLEAGADDYVTKPFKMTELQARVARLLASRRLLRAQFSREIVVQPTGIIITPEAEAFYERIRLIVERHVSHSHFTVEMLAEEAGLSKSVLTRKLRAATGLTPGVFMRHLRLEHAAQRLARGAGNVSTVARAVGYADVDHFTRLFKSHFGVAPSQYRATHS